MLPAGQDVALNPYTHLLCVHLVRAGVDVSSANAPRRALRSCDIIHVHWPHGYADMRSLPQALLRSGLLLLLCGLARARGGKLVWTVHNLKSHEPVRPWLEAPMMALFTRMTDGLIFLNRVSEQGLDTERPYMAGAARAQIPHGVYGASYPPPASRLDARRELGLDEHAFVVVCPGDIKPYKNLGALIGAVGKLADPGLHLLIAGRCDPPEYEAVIQAQVAAAVGAGASIGWRNARPSDAELATVIDASDVVALPYARTWNSGLAILALERRRRLVCSDADSFRELADETGAYWIHVAEGATDLFGLRTMLRGAPSVEDTLRLDRFLSRRQWDEIAASTLAFYEQLTATPPARPPAGGASQPG